MQNNLRPNSNNNQPPRVAISATQFAGPIPPPQILEKYNQIVPSAAERIIAMAEKQSDHRMSLESKVISSNIIKSYLGMFLAATIAIFGLWVCMQIAIKGNPATAAIIAAIDLGSLIAIAMNNSSRQKQQRDDRKNSSIAPPSGSI